MKIFPTIRQNFKGHAAGRIKNLYMQNPECASQIQIYNQLREIGSAEGFDVVMHGVNYLATSKLNMPVKFQYLDWGVWSQDNKIFLSRNGVSTLHSSDIAYEQLSSEVENLAKVSKHPHLKTQSILDGGAVFFGKKDNGDRYALINECNIEYNALLQYIKSKNPPRLDKEILDELHTNKTQYQIGEIELSWSEYEERKEFFTQRVLKAISLDYDIKPENIIILPDNDYHLDLTIRPLDYPYVLVNDDKAVDEALDKYNDKFRDDFFYHMFFARELEASVAQHRKRFCSSDELCKKLEENGFIPIKIAGMFGRGSINFMNAIVHQADDGLVYITNSLNCKTDYLRVIQDDFEKKLLELCPQIKRIHFVSGESFGTDSNDIMFYLKEKQGGIHCLCAEEMAE